MLDNSYYFICTRPFRMNTERAEQVFSPGEVYEGRLVNSSYKDTIADYLQHIDVEEVHLAQDIDFLFRDDDNENHYMSLAGLLINGFNPVTLHEYAY